MYSRNMCSCSPPTILTTIAHVIRSPATHSCYSLTCSSLILFARLRFAHLSSSRLSTSKSSRLYFWYSLVGLSKKLVRLSTEMRFIQSKGFSEL